MQPISKAAAARPRLLQALMHRQPRWLMHLQKRIRLQLRRARVRRLVLAIEPLVIHEY